MENYSYDILCLANSKKPPSGRCVAGKVVSGVHSGIWVRPVSARPSREVSEDERSYSNGEKVKLLDIVNIPLLRPEPLKHQLENHVLDDSLYWVRRGVACWNDIINLVDPYDPNFWSNSQSTSNGLNDKVAECFVLGLGGSLRLVSVSDLIFSVRTEAGFEGSPSRRRVRAKFTFNSKSYCLSLTDPEVEVHYLRKADGEYGAGSAVICVSVVELWKGYAFRVVASVLTPTRFGF